MALLSKDEWNTLTRLYGLGSAGAEYNGNGYGTVGTWAVIAHLRDHDPTLAREITKLDPVNNRVRYLVIITKAGERYYEENRRLYNVLYAPP
jgi:hypothetical protein